MRHTLAIIAVAASFAVPAYAASTAADLLAANKAASGGAVWDKAATLKTDFDYSGMGMTGKVSSIADLHNGRFVDNAAIGPVTQVQGFDGSSAWEKDPSGTVTPQNGSGKYMAINEAYPATPICGGARISAAHRSRSIRRRPTAARPMTS